jgi:niacin transporter
MTTRALTATAVLLALGVMLPIALHAVPLGGRVLLPMHIPVLIAGLLLGPAAGLVVGAGSPVLSLLLTGRPPLPYMLPMLFELAAYGAVAGLVRPRIERVFARRGAPGAAQGPAGPTGAPTSRSYLALILSLLVAMLAGRAVWVAVVLWLAPVIGITARTAAAAFAALGAGWIGMALQLAIVPAIVRAVERPRIA